METIRALIADVDDLHEEISGWELHGIALQGRRDRLVEALVDAGLRPRRVKNEVARLEFTVTWPLRPEEPRVADMSEAEFQAALRALPDVVRELGDPDVSTESSIFASHSTGGENADER